MIEEKLLFTKCWYWEEDGEQRMRTDPWKGECPDDVERYSSDNPHLYTAEEKNADPHGGGGDESWMIVASADPDLVWFGLDFDTDEGHDASIPFPLDDLVVDLDEFTAVKTKGGGLHLHLFLQRENLPEYVGTEVKGIDLLGHLETAQEKHIAASPWDDERYEIIQEGVADVTRPFNSGLINEQITVPDYGQDLLTFDEQVVSSNTVSAEVPKEPPEEVPRCIQELTELRMDTGDARSNYGPFSVDSHLGQLLIANGYDKEQCFEYFQEFPKKGDPSEFDANETDYQLGNLFRKDLHPPFSALEPQINWKDCDCHVHSNEDDWRTLEGDLDWVVDRYYDDDDSLGLRGARQLAADAFDRHLEFVYPEEGAHSWLPKLHVYDDGQLVDTESEGTYISRGGQVVSSLAEEYLGALFDRNFKSQLIGKLEWRNVASAQDLETDPERLVVANGILDLTTGTMFPHTPNEYHQRRLDWDYDPDARPERFDEFLDNVVGEAKHKQLLYQFIAHSLYDNYEEEKALMLHGSGANGKTIFLTAIEAFLGRGNYSGLSLHSISDEPHCRDRVIGKFANISADIDDHEVKNIGTFKQMVGGDVININPKYEDTFPHRNTATMMFSANSIPKFGGNTKGIWRRWCLVPFPNDFDPDDDDYIPEAELLDQLTAEEEMKGILARAVEEIKEWNDGRAWFSQADGWKETRKKMQRAADPVYDFAEVALHQDTDGVVTKEDARNAYNQFAEENDVKKLSGSQFGKRIKEVELTISSGQNRINGERKPTYQGVAFTGRGEQLLREYHSDQEAEPSSIGDF